MIELGLQRISRLLQNTPLPWRAIHIAGTNGKGSVCAYLSAMLDVYNGSKFRSLSGLRALRHGRFTSPHLVDRWDCISLSGYEGRETKSVAREVFLEVEAEVQARNSSLGVRASEFEVLTATAFEIFTRSEVDVAVVETGMGGRLDATNVLGRSLESAAGEGSGTALRQKPLVTAITKIGLDHQAFLGDSLEAIAREKAGILKSGVPVVYDNSNLASVSGILLEVAESVSSPLVVPVGSHDPSNSVLNANVAYEAAQIALRGLDRIPPRLSSQEAASEESRALQTLLSEIRSAPDSVTFAGRLESLDISAITGAAPQQILLDGAHNSQSAAVLAEHVSAHYRKKGSEQITWLLAASDTKDVAEILRPLLQPGDDVLAVEFGPVDGMPWVRAMRDGKIIAAALETVPSGLQTTIGLGRDVEYALEYASKLSQRSGVGRLVVAGSLYLVGDVHRLLRKARGEIKS